MLLASQLILFSGGLLLIAILASVISSRVGAPLLLVFLGLGMLLGEDGLGVPFENYDIAFVVGSVALAVILFDGGFRTPLASLRLAWAPAGLLATVGVALTAGVVGGVVAVATGLDPVAALLMGAIVASTDAAAVFLLLHQQGMQLRRRVSTTLEVESGCNDPLAVFLTITLVSYLTAEVTGPWAILQLLALQFGLGALAGFAGGYVLTWTINRLELAPGLYPVFVVAATLFVFGGTQLLDGSGFLAVYIAGIICGNRRIRANKLIGRFHDGIAWVCQIVMFVMLGLLITPSAMVADLPLALLVAGTLIFIARPVAVWLCLLPFRFTREEILFVAWVGLRGAVPIFLAMIPILGGVEQAQTYFHVAFMVVLASMILQGWTVPPLAEKLELETDPLPEPRGRLDIELPDTADQEVAGYRVDPQSWGVGRPIDALTWPQGARLLAVLRGDRVIAPGDVATLQGGDYLLTLCPPEHTVTLDRQLIAPTRPRTPGAERGMGDFVVPGDVPLADIAATYGLIVPAAQRATPVGTFLRRNLRGTPSVGDHIAFDRIDLVVREVSPDGQVTAVALRLVPARIGLVPERLHGWTAGLLNRLRRRPRSRGSAAVGQGRAAEAPTDAAAPRDQTGETPR